jgi:hypothetical protein
VTARRYPRRSQEKWIQKFEEELEEMNKNESPEEPQVEKSAEEIEGEPTNDGNVVCA